MHKKSQAWSVDVVIAVSLFFLGMIMLYYFIGVQSDDDVSERVTEEAERLPELLSTERNDSFSFIREGKVDPEMLEDFVNLTYNDTKLALGIQSDFCIFFEDEEGNIVNISGSLIGIGSEKAKISGIECGKR